ncbi:MAG: alpha-1,2-fucosyltransferase [Cyclobacteriaceae bacterium]
MVISKIQGGLGNQLFQFAAAKSLSLNKKVPLILDISHYKQRHNQSITNRSFLLDKIINSPIIYSHNWRVRLHKSINRYQDYIEKDFGYSPQINNVPDNVTLNGYFQSEKYFAHNTAAICNSINSLYEANGQLESPSIGVHVRRGDYLTNTIAYNVLGPLDIEYYIKGLNRLEKALNIPKESMRIKVFSDDLDWCKQAFTFLHGHEFINSGDPIKDLNLMSQCDHQIIANSSFSWWAAWLNKNVEKVVIAPQSWFKDTTKSINDLLPRGWITL